VTVLIAKAVTPGVRGELSRWMLEVDAGVFVGNIPARVRDKLWEKLFWKLGHKGAAIMIHPARNEQGFAVRTEGLLDRTLVDMEGLYLMRFKRMRDKMRKPEKKSNDLDSEG
jgi:CRISPR-associated protein Cas2